MASISIDDVLQVVLTWDAPLASVAQNVWHLIMETGAGADSDDILAELLVRMQVAQALIEGSQSDTFEAVLLELRRWDFTLHRFDGIGTLAVTGVVGAASTDYEPHGVAALGRIITEAARRQGGHFLPGLVDGAIVQGVLASSVEAAFATYLSTFVADIIVTGGVLPWCTFNVEPTSPVYETASKATGTVIANSLPSYLSKRKPGIGL